MKRSNGWVAFALVGTAALGVSSWALAAEPEPDAPAEPKQTEPKPAEPSAESQDEPSESEPSDADPKGQEPDGTDAVNPAAIPSLDELLGLEQDGGDVSEMPDPSRQELERRLERAEQQRQAEEQFARAVQLMDDAAQRLTGGRDPGVVTQRLQEDVLRSLDTMIEMAESQSNSNPSPSSSQGQASSRPAPAQQGQEAQAQEMSTGDSQQESTAPPGGAAQLGPDLAANRAAWGDLPERVREALVQGSGDTFSSLYRSMTERYYRRLAEESER